MTVPWLQEFESLEEISQQEDVRLLCLRMAAMSQRGGLDSFLRHVARDDELDDETKGTVSELAGCRSFLLALEDYVGRTRILH
jgi:hypothetical protein